MNSKKIELIKFELIKKEIMEEINLNELLKFQEILKKINKEKIKK